MKIIKTANGKKIKMSKSEWQSIGKTAGWLTANPNGNNSNWLTNIPNLNDELDPTRLKENVLMINPEPLFNTSEDAVQWVQSKGDAPQASRGIKDLLDNFMYRGAMYKAKITMTDVIAAIHDTYSGKDTQTLYNLIQQIEASISEAFRSNLK